MDRSTLIAQIRHKKSFLCVGLDPDWDKIPAYLKETEDPLFEFNRRIIDATHDLCVAFKPNSAFYEAQGIRGMQSLEKTIRYLDENYPSVFTIADAKRGDIGNTSKMYAKAFFEHLPFDAITVAPYMGEDSVTPFLEYPGKWVILLALTSNRGALDFQPLSLQSLGEEAPEKVFERVLRVSSEWGNTGNMMYVVGATQAPMLADIRRIVPDHFLLVPGVGAQGGSLEEVVKHGMNRDCGLLVNASRSILYAGSDIHFEQAAREEAQRLQQEMAALL